MSVSNKEKQTERKKERREPKREDKYNDSDNRYDKKNYNNDQRKYSHSNSQTNTFVSMNKQDQQDQQDQQDEENQERHDTITLGKNRDYDNLPESIDDFENMTFLSPELFQGVHSYGFKYPSPIQAKTIHIINNGCDLIAQSQSGSGKTGAFTIGSLSRVKPKDCYPQVLIIANTRLLALQIWKVVQNVSQFMNIEVCPCVGGYRNSSQTNAQQVRNSHVLVGTPGRISDMLAKRAFDGKLIKTLIMDESDVLLQDNFKQQTADIITKMGENTQICIFSATFTKDTLQLTEKFLRNPYRITVEKENISVKDVKQYSVMIGYDRNKFATLKDLFTKLIFNQMIIFVKSVTNAEILRNKLMDQDIEAGLVHRKMNSSDRENVLKEFRLSYIKILISTDIMCRGIDIDDLRIVINFDMPDDPETYIHRIGRSGRYGGQGIAINFCTYDDVHKITILNREFKLDIRDLPDPDNVNEILTGMKPSKNKVLSVNNYI
jgi:translation initiation factor 4A